MDRYFIYSSSQMMDMEKLIKNKEIKANVIDLIVRKSPEQQRLTWFLLENDISFKRKPMGSGITSFTIDRSMPFFIQAKPKAEANDEKNKKETLPTVKRSPKDGNQ